LTDEEWSLVVPLIPPAKSGGNKRTVNLREVMNGITYVLGTGCQWRAIPKDLPPRSTLFGYLDLWSYDGTLDCIHHALFHSVPRGGRAGVALALPQRLLSLPRAVRAVAGVETRIFDAVDCERLLAFPAAAAIVRCRLRNYVWRPHQRRWQAFGMELVQQLLASFPALLAVAMVSKYSDDCSIGLVRPAR
jgi:transposase